MVGAGQVVGMIKKIRNVQEVMDDLVQGAIQTFTVKVPATVIIK